MTEKLTTSLWFNGNAAEAANFYVSLFPNSRIENIARYPVDDEHGHKGSVLMVTFQILGQSFSAINGGADFPFTDAISISVECDDQEQVDRYWQALTADGGSEVQCGWLKDRYGLSWQIVPKKLGELMEKADDQQAASVFNAMMQMIKLDEVELERAYERV